MRNAISRRRCASVSAENSSSSKISASGKNEIVVPVLLRVADDLHVALRHAARELLAVDLAVAPTSATSHSDSALTTETPTPCRPPETL